jgi:DNA-binding transcriptional LysR family regulator
MKEPDWSDLKFFLAVARSGKISSVGSNFGIEHSTVKRRIGTLEADLGAVLFDRSRTGYLLTDAGRALIPHAERIETAVLRTMEECVGHARGVSGKVRVGSPEAFGVKILVPSLISLYREHPDLCVELMNQPQFPSLVSREVEILVTLERPTRGRYISSRLGEVDYYLFGSAEYLAANPPIASIEDLAQHSFVDYIQDGYMSQKYQILSELLPSTPRRTFTSTSVLAQRAAAASGLGLILLSNYVATRLDDLVSVFPDTPLMSRTLWIAAPEDLFKIFRVRCVWDHIRKLSERPNDFLSRVV